MPRSLAHPTNNFIIGTNAGLLPAPSAPVTSTVIVPAGPSAPSAPSSVDAFASTPTHRYPLRQRKVTDHFDPAAHNKIMAKAFAAAAEPQNHNQAIKSPDAAHWLAAEKEEINNLLSNKTWDLVELPPNCKVIGVCWVYKIKLNNVG